MARFDLTDFEWSVIEPLLPTKVRGVPRVDDRRVLNGIFWRLRTGAPWADIPLAPCRPLGADIGLGVSSLPRRCADDRQFLDPGSPTWRQWR